MAAERPRALAGRFWPGHDAESAARIPYAGWRQIACRVWRSVGEDHVTLMAAGLAFYGMLAALPDADRGDHPLWPGRRSRPGPGPGGRPSRTPCPAAGRWCATSSRRSSPTSSQTLSWGLVVSVGAALWSASAGAANLIDHGQPRLRRAGDARLSAPKRAGAGVDHRRHPLRPGRRRAHRHRCRWCSHRLGLRRHRPHAGGLAALAVAARDGHDRPGGDLQDRAGPHARRACAGSPGARRWRSSCGSP